MLSRATELRVRTSRFARDERVLIAVLAGGLVLRLAIAFATTGQPFDVASAERARHELVTRGLDFYSYVNLGNWYWPYLPTFLPFLVVAYAVANATGLPFHGVLQIPSIVADLLIAWFVYDFLRRTASPTVGIVAAALVAFGPTFVLVSGYHGQIDPVAILPVVVAAWGWERGGRGGRPGLSGALVGAAAAFKTAPGVAVLAFAPQLASWRRRLMLAVAAVAVPVAVVLPFLIADARAVATIRNYRGWPGQGGLTLLIQPSLAASWLLGPERKPPRYSSATTFIVDNGEWIVLGLLVVVGAVLVRQGLPPVQGLIIVFLALLSFGPGYFHQYVVWVLPFLLMAGYLRYAALLQVLLTVPMVLYYAGPWDTEVVVGPYVVVMITLWLTWVAALAAILVRSGPRPAANVVTRC